MKNKSKLSNRRSLCASVLRNVWLLKCVRLHNNPTSFLPKRFDYSVSAPTLLSLQTVSAGVSNLCRRIGIGTAFVQTFPVVIAEYTKIFSGCFILLGGRFAKILHIINADFGVIFVAEEWIRSSPRQLAKCGQIFVERPQHIQARLEGQTMDDPNTFYLTRIHEVL